MEKSESIAKISSAIVKAQHLIGGARKNAVNPHLKNKYANLESVWEAISPAMESSKLAAIQSPQPSDDGKLHLETMIIHESGEFISGTLVIPLPKQDPQGYGSALTYARRYHLSAMLGVIQDDDDAQAASKGSASLAADEIMACKNVDDLKKAFESAYAKFKDDPASIRVITDAKDKRKSQLGISKDAGFNPVKLQKQEQIKQESAPVTNTESQPIEDF